MIINKEKILEGLNHKTEFEVPELGGSVLIRQVSNIEHAKIQALAVDGIDTSTFAGKSLDEIKDFSGIEIGKVFVNSAEADVQLCSWCIVDPAGKSIFSKEEIDRFPVGVPSKIAAEIRRISGFDVKEAEIINFRGIGGRTGDINLNASGLQIIPKHPASYISPEIDNTSI